MTAANTERVGSEPVDGLPADFVWGAATSAYQIEGAAAVDGRRPSGTPSVTRRPRPRRLPLLRGLAPRPAERQGAGECARARLLRPSGRRTAGQGHHPLGHTPWATLYHCDLPQELEDAGGRPNRDTAYRFAEYAEYAWIVAEALGDRVNHWITLNEPYCAAMLGYYHGVHAPGRRHFPDFTGAAHHLLLGHGLAVQQVRVRAAQPPRIGITVNPLVAHPFSDAPEDVEAARRADALGTRLHLDPVVHGRCPADLLADLAPQDAGPPVEDGDLRTIAQPLDFLGVNYYFRDVVRPSDEPHGYRTVPQTDRPSTAMPWEIYPEGLTDLLIRISREYPGLPLYITENGAAFDDTSSPVDETGRIQDTDRIAFLADHLAAIGKARAAGADVRGYFCWSLMDNFEWAYGYAKRFGLVHVDYATQRRIPKASALWLRDVAVASRTR